MALGRSLFYVSIVGRVWRHHVGRSKENRVPDVPLRPFRKEVLKTKKQKGSIEETSS